MKKQTAVKSNIPTHAYHNDENDFFVWTDSLVAFHNRWRQDLNHNL